MSLLTELCPFVDDEATNMPALTGFKKIRVSSVFHLWLEIQTPLPRSSTPNCHWPHGWDFARERARPGGRFRHRAENRFLTWDVAG
jgi:hypothetical protein